MSAQVQQNQPTPPQAVENKPSDKELNFRMLEQKYQKQLDQSNAERDRSNAERDRLAKELEQKSRLPYKDDDEDDSEPYVDHKKLRREQAKFGQQLKQETQSEIQNAVQNALKQERQQNWIKSNPDFYDVMKHAEKFAQADPELAETILEMPEGFERQKLVYKNIKALGIHKPDVKAPSIQDKIDANRRSPYYQPSGIASAPYEGNKGDFSPSGQKNAYEKMQQLKNQLRI